MANETLDQIWPQHKEQFNEKTSSLIRTTIAITKIENPMERDDAVRRAQQRIREIELLLETMKSDLRAMPLPNPQWRNHFSHELQQCKQDFQQNRKEFHAALTRHRFLQMNPVEREQRKRLLHNEQVHENIKRSSEKSLRLIESTETVAQDTSGILYTQGQQFSQIHIDLKEVNENNERARRLLIGLRRRMMTDRILQTFIVFIEIVIIAIIIWYRWIRQ